MILLTSEPKSGKSTAIMKTVHMLGPGNCRGFFTEQVRVDGERTGFRIRTLSGKTGKLASVDTDSVYRVDRYGVDLGSFESLCIPEIEAAIRSGRDQYLIIDEIGPMQLFSERFREILYRLLDSQIRVVGTIVLRNDEWTAAFKSDPRVHLLSLTAENRNVLPLQVCRLAGEDDKEFLSKVRKAENYILSPERFEISEDEVIMRSTHDVRRIRKSGENYSCTCDYYARRGTCSHIMSVITANLL